MKSLNKLLAWLDAGLTTAPSERRLSKEDWDEAREELRAALAQLQATSAADAPPSIWVSPEMLFMMSGGSLNFSRRFTAEHPIELRVVAAVEADKYGRLIPGPPEQRKSAAPAVPKAGNWINADDVQRLTRELDVLLNGEEGAAPQASLCDLVAQVRAAKQAAPQASQGAAPAPEPTYHLSAAEHGAMRRALRSSVTIIDEPAAPQAEQQAVPHSASIEDAASKARKLAHGRDAAAYRDAVTDLGRAYLAEFPTRAALAAQQAEREPIDMVLHCPKCGMQHIDAPESALETQPDGSAHYEEHWTNPPHRSHLCHGCGHIWRPADVPTNGVQAVKTKGKADSPVMQQAERKPLTDEFIDALWVTSPQDPDGNDFVEFARAIERAHGIGKEGAR